VRDLTGQGVVLLVEDEAPVRSFAARALRLRGYTVLEAGSGEEALEVVADPDTRIDLLVSDVVMPGIDGPTWVRKAREDRPDVRVIFVSGYAEDVFRADGGGLPDAAFMPKPFSLNELTQKVKEVLELG
jgi:two-component system, cell cycle sensor histidine kinase and response regulator CckA